MNHPQMEKNKKRKVFLYPLFVSEAFLVSSNCRVHVLVSNLAFWDGFKDSSFLSNSEAELL